MEAFHVEEKESTNQGQRISYKRHYQDESPARGRKGASKRVMQEVRSFAWSDGEGCRKEGGSTWFPRGTVWRASTWYLSGRYQEAIIRGPRRKAGAWNLSHIATKRKKSSEASHRNRPARHQEIPGKKCQCAMRPRLTKKLPNRKRGGGPGSKEDCPARELTLRGGELGGPRKRAFLLLKRTLGREKKRDLKRNRTTATKIPPIQKREKRSLEASRGRRS